MSQKRGQIGQVGQLGFGRLVAGLSVAVAAVLFTTWVTIKFTSGAVAFYRADVPMYLSKLTALPSYLWLSNQFHWIVAGAQNVLMGWWTWLMGTSVVVSIGASIKYSMSVRNPWDNHKNFLFFVAPTMLCFIVPGVSLFISCIYAVSTLGGLMGSSYLLRKWIGSKIKHWFFFFLCAVYLIAAVIAYKVRSSFVFRKEANSKKTVEKILQVSGALMPMVWMFSPDGLTQQMAYVYDGFVRWGWALGGVLKSFGVENADEMLSTTTLLLAKNPWRCGNFLSNSGLNLIVKESISATEVDEFREYEDLQRSNGLFKSGVEQESISRGAVVPEKLKFLFFHILMLLNIVGFIFHKRRLEDKNRSDLFSQAIDVPLAKVDVMVNDSEVSTQVLAKEMEEARQGKDITRMAQISSEFNRRRDESKSERKDDVKNDLLVSRGMLSSTGGSDGTPTPNVATSRISVSDSNGPKRIINIDKKYGDVAPPNYPATKIDEKFIDQQIDDVVKSMSKGVEGESGVPKNQSYVTLKFGKFTDQELDKLILNVQGVLNGKTVSQDAKEFLQRAKRTRAKRHLNNLGALMQLKNMGIIKEEKLTKEQIKMMEMSETELEEIPLKTYKNPYESISIDVGSLGVLVKESVTLADLKTKVKKSAVQFYSDPTEATLKYALFDSDARNLGGGVVSISDFNKLTRLGALDFMSIQDKVKVDVDDIQNITIYDDKHQVVARHDLKRAHVPVVDNQNLKKSQGERVVQETSFSQCVPATRGDVGKREAASSPTSNNKRHHCDAEDDGGVEKECGRIEEAVDRKYQGGEQTKSGGFGAKILTVLSLWVAYTFGRELSNTFLESQQVSSQTRVGAIPSTKDSGTSDQFNRGSGCSDESPNTACTKNSGGASKAERRINSLMDTWEYFQPNVQKEGPFGEAPLKFTRANLAATALIATSVINGRKECYILGTQTVGTQGVWGAWHSITELQKLLIIDSSTQVALVGPSCFFSFSTVEFLSRVKRYRDKDVFLLPLTGVERGVFKVRIPERVETSKEQLTCYMSVWSSTALNNPVVLLMANDLTRMLEVENCYTSCAHLEDRGGDMLIMHPTFTTGGHSGAGVITKVGHMIGVHMQRNNTRQSNEAIAFTTEMLDFAKQANLLPGNGLVGNGPPSHPDS